MPRRALLLAWAGRLTAVVTVAIGLLILTAAPAAADPPDPTNYRSQIDDIAPDVDGLRASIVGGDGFLLLEGDAGTTVEVPGYSGEPYLRFADDGTVQENQASPAKYLNEARTRTDDGGIDPDAEPRWKVVATDGRWAWHDHRIHHMGGGTPAAARSDAGVSWEVPLVVDGEDVIITGNYRLLPAPSPLPWIALSLGVALVVALGLSRLLPALTAGGATVVAAGLGGVVAGIAQRGASPPGASTSTLVVILPALAALAGILVLVRRGRILRAVVTLAGAAALGGWALVRVQFLWKALLPTSLPAATDRLLTSLALGAAAGAAVLVIRSGALAPDLSELDEGQPAPTRS